MRDYFESEMRLLRDAAREFAEAHPEQARMLRLGESGDRDPYIERLLEGMAFLTAHVRERIDESRAAVSEQLLARLCPAQIRPYPSATVLEFRPRSWRQAEQVIPAGAIVRSRPVGPGGVRCAFRVTRGLRVHPLELGDLRARETEAGETALTLELRGHGSTPLGRLGVETLDLYLRADPSLSASLYAVLTDPDARRRFAADGGAWVAAPGALRFRSLGVADGGGLLPAPDGGSVGLDLLQDYFCFRERYLFLRLEGLDALPLEQTEERLVIELTSATRLPTGHALSADNLRLFCVPAVNLWATDAEPITLDHRRGEYRVVAEAGRPEEVGVYAVEAVTARGQRSGTVQALQPLHRLRPGETGRHYHVTRHGHGHGSGLPQAYLQIAGGPATEQETLSARILACNGHLPCRELEEGDVREPGDDVPGGLRMRNITRPSPCYPPPSAQSHPARLHGFLMASVGSLAEAATLRRLLHLMDWSERPENRRRIEAIRHVEAAPVHRVADGLLQRGIAVHADIEEGGFLSLEDIRLFGDVLHAYLGRVTAVNEFVALTLTTQPRQRAFTWQPRTGRSSPL